MIQKKLQTNYSPEQMLSHDVSDSLKDFSLGQEAEAGAAVSNDFCQGAPLLDFENSYKNGTVVMNTISNLWQDPASMAV